MSVWTGFIGWVGYLEGEPVSTAATVIGGGASGSITWPPCRSTRSAATAKTVMRHAIAEAPAPPRHRHTILQSTPAGHRLYQRMGFRTVTNIAVYAS